MFYLLNLLLVPIYYLFLVKLGGAKNKRNEIFIKIVCLHAILFRAFANPLNYVDTEGYARAFENISSMSFSEAIISIYSVWGLGFVTLNWLLAQISSNSQVLFVFLSITTVGGIMWFYKKTSYSFFMTTFFFLTYPMLYYMSFGVVRHHFAIVFILLTLYYIDDYKISIPLSIIAVLMHTSNIVFIPFFFWRKMNFERRNIFTILAFAIVGLILLRASMSTILSYLPRYSNQGFGEEGDNNTLPIIILGLTTILVYLSGTSKRLSSPQEKNIISFLTYGFMISLFCFGLQGAGRLTLMFIYVLPVIFSYLKIYAKQRILYYNVYMFSIFCLIFYLIYASYDPILYDYISVFETVKDYK